MHKAKLKYVLIAALVCASATLSFAQESKLIAVLKSDASQKEKVDACRELARVGTKEAVPVLAGLLTDEKLSHMARYALEPIQDPSVDDALRAALGKTTGNLRTGIIHSIGVRRDARAVDPLIQLLPDAAAASALARIGTPAAIAALEKGLPATAPACLIVAEKSPALYQRLLDPQIPAPIRQGAMRGAIVTGKKPAALITKALQGEDFAMAAIAVRASMEVPGKEVTRALTGVVGNLPDDRKLMVVQALGTRSDNSAVTTLIPLAKTGAADIRVAAIRSLVQIGNGAVVPVLTELAVATEADIANAAKAGLAGIAGSEAENAIIALLKDTDPQKRRLGVDLVGERRITKAVPSLLKTATDDDAAVSTASLKVLGEMAGKADVPALTKILLTTKQLSAAENALASVCKRQDEQCAAVLCGAFTKAPVPAKLALLRILRTAGGTKALEGVRAAVKDPSPEVQDTALRVLCDWTGAEALPDVAQLAKSTPDETLKILALRGYVHLISTSAAPAEQKVAQLQEALALAGRSDEKKMALAALGKVPTVEALKLVMKEISVPDLKEEACQAALSIGEKLVRTESALVSEVMKQVVKATENEEIVKRAQVLVRDAK